MLFYTEHQGLKQMFVLVKFCYQNVVYYYGDSINDIAHYSTNILIYLDNK